MFVLSALLSVAHKEKILKEVSIMLSLNHPNVMSLIGLCIDSEMPLLLMPFMSKGNVLKYVKNNREKLYFIEKKDVFEVRHTHTQIHVHNRIFGYMHA